MAHSLQAKKRIRQNLRRAVHNRTRTSRTRTFIRRVESAIESGDREAARAALAAAEPEMAKGAQKGKFHRNTMQRKLSRLSKRIKGMEG